MPFGSRIGSGSTLRAPFADAPGWLFVLPWSLEEFGGVNEALKSLIRCFQQNEALSPLVLITSGELKARVTRESEWVETFWLDLWGPWDPRHPVRAVLSFVLRLPARYWKLCRMVKEHDIRIINPHFPGLGALTFLILRKSGQFNGKFILSFHGSDIKGALSTTGLERSLWRTLLRGADHIAVVSDDLGRRVLALEPAVAGKLRTVYNGVDMAMFALVKRDRDLRPPGADEGQTVVSVGVFAAIKGQDVLVRAFSRVASRVGGARLHLVGESGPELEHIRHLVGSLSLNERVEIFQNVPHEQIPAYLARATLFALATRGEGNPLSVIEAGAAGLPVVCTRGSGLSELITDGVTGRLVEIDDEAALAEAMVDLLTHPEEARRLAQNFHDGVKTHLTWQHTYERYLDLVSGRSRGTAPVVAAGGNLSV